jgi:hypothetical protein
MKSKQVTWRSNWLIIVPMVICVDVTGAVSFLLPKKKGN